MKYGRMARARNGRVGYERHRRACGQAGCIMVNGHSTLIRSPIFSESNLGRPLGVGFKFGSSGRTATHVHGYFGVVCTTATKPPVIRTC